MYSPVLYESLIKNNNMKNKSWYMYSICGLVAVLFLIGSYSYYLSVRNNELTRLAETKKSEPEKKISENNVDVDDKLLNKITPDDQSLYFAGKDFKLQYIAYSDDNEWDRGAYYSLNGGTFSENNAEGLFLHFYMKGMFKNEELTARSVAQDLAHSNTANASDKHPAIKLINQFTAPDDITKLPNYFIISSITYEGAAYVDVIKISSLESSVFSVRYSKIFINDNINLENDINNWIINDVFLPGGVFKSMADIRVDSSWLDYFANYEQ